MFEIKLNLTQEQLERSIGFLDTLIDKNVFTELSYETYVVLESLAVELANAKEKKIRLDAAHSIPKDIKCRCGHNRSFHSITSTPVCSKESCWCENWAP